MDRYMDGAAARRHPRGRAERGAHLARQAPLGDRLSRQGTAWKSGETLVSFGLDHFLGATMRPAHSVLPALLRSTDGTAPSGRRSLGAAGKRAVAAAAALAAALMAFPLS